VLHTLISAILYGTLISCFLFIWATTFLD